MTHARRHTALHAALVALALVLAGSVAAPAASASSDQAFPVGGADFQRARDIAHAHWGAVPCQGQVAYTWSGLEPLVNARATWSNPTDAWANAGANFDCQVAFNALTQYDFPMLCTVMTHEVGHLLGHQHDEQAGQLMSAIYSTPLPECTDGTTPTATAAGEQAGDPIAWSVSESKARTKKTKKVRASRTAKRKRCVVRLKGGKRTKRCVTLKKRSSRKAHTASHRPAVRRYAAR